jgi:ADP-ribose pyrophosphatase YjhB (NUDIX family)
MIPLVYKVVHRLRCFFWATFRIKTHGVKAIIASEDKILFVRHSYGDQAWNFPGGGVKRNEVAINAVIREIKEELNIDIHPTYIGAFVNNTEGWHDDVDVFQAEIGDSTSIHPNAEIADVTWFDHNALPLDTIAHPALTALRLTKIIL